jgi:hypothetical protein
MQGHDGVAFCAHAARMHDGERSHHQLKLLRRYLQPLNNDFDQVEIDGKADARCTTAFDLGGTPRSRQGRQPYP